MKEKIAIFLLVSSLIPIFCFGQEDLSEINEIGRGREIIEFVKDLWKDDIVPFLKRIWGTIVNFWENSIKPLFQKEVEKRKPVIEDQIKKEKEEFKEEFPEIRKSLWERLKSIISK
jgi:hypothetical protein